MSFKNDDGGSSFKVYVDAGGELTQEQVDSAIRFIAGQATDAADARNLMEMLGLVDVPPVEREIEKYDTYCPVCDEPMRKKNLPRHKRRFHEDEEAA